MDVSKKLNKLEVGLGISLLTTELLIGIPLAIGYLAHETYITFKKSTPAINEFVSTYKSKIFSDNQDLDSNEDS